MILWRIYGLLHVLHQALVTWFGGGRNKCLSLSLPCLQANWIISSHFSHGQLQLQCLFFPVRPTLSELDVSTFTFQLPVRFILLIPRRTNHSFWGDGFSDLVVFLLCHLLINSPFEQHLCPWPALIFLFVIPWPLFFHHRQNRLPTSTFYPRTMWKVLLCEELSTKAQNIESSISLNPPQLRPSSSVPSVSSQLCSYRTQRRSLNHFPPFTYLLLQPLNCSHPSHLSLYNCFWGRISTFNILLTLEFEKFSFSL